MGKSTCCIDPIATVYELDVLAFALIISSTAKLKTMGVRVSVVLATIVEDSTLFFSGYICFPVRAGDILDPWTGEYDCSGFSFWAAAVNGI